MKIQMRDGLPFVSVTLRHGEHDLELHDVLLDTGSAGTVVSVDSLLAIGLVYDPDDPIHRIQGVGGSEFVFLKRVDLVAIGELQVTDFAVEGGAMDYGFEINGIVGTDFLVAVGTIIDLRTLELR
ncbi:MAG TPA: aspartyl protease family protein [Blastocatellia bacterium]|nr:aspartyl protease family protein [Blastocatellia bacterium]